MLLKHIVHFVVLSCYLGMMDLDLSPESNDHFECAEKKPFATSTCFENDVRMIQYPKGFFPLDFLSWQKPEV